MPLVLVLKASLGEPCPSWGFRVSLNVQFQILD